MRQAKPQRKLKALFSAYHSGRLIADNLAGDNALFLKEQIPTLVIKFARMEGV